MYQNYPLALTLIRLGGHHGPPLDISRDNSATRKALATTPYDNFLWQFPEHFETKFVTPGGTVPRLRNFLYMHVGPKKAQNGILCAKSMQIDFFHLVHINMLIFTLNGWN